MPAEKIDTRWAKMPPLSMKLLETIAQEGEMAAFEFIEMATGDANGTIPAGVMSDAMWMAVARAMYATVAKVGGARVETIVEQEP